MKAQELFDINNRCEQAKDEMFHKLLEICGFGHDTVEQIEQWPMQDWTFDDYDSSFEFKETKNDFVFTPDQLEKFWELGFGQCWICHCNGSEHSYAKGGNPAGYFKGPLGSVAKTATALDS